MATQQQTDLIVVGGGLAGLAAAAYAGRAGFSVTVLERSHESGGMARTSNESGFQLNLGAHALYRGGAAEAVLAELGVAFTGGIPESKTYQAARRGKLFPFVYGARTLMTSRMFGPRAKLEVARTLMKLPDADIAWLDTLSVSEWLAAEAPSPAGRQYLEAVIRLATYSNDPEGLAASAAVTGLRSSGVTYLDGGWQTLVDGLSRAATAAGAVLRTSARVDEVVVEDGRAIGVRLAGGEPMLARAVLIAAPPMDAAAMLAGAGLAETKRWVDQARPAKVAVLDLCLRSLPRARRVFALGIDQPLYLSVHSNIAKLAPDGSSLVSLMRHLPPGEDDAEESLHDLEAFADFYQPGWRELEVARQFLPSLTAVNWKVTAASGGFAGRPEPRVPGVAGVYVAGDWVGHTGMLADAVLSSAREAIQLLAADLPRSARVDIADALPASIAS
ncbi:MAG: phytoene desaturase family protein [Tepidiformaceae bacterium]